MFAVPHAHTNVMNDRSNLITSLLTNIRYAALIYTSLFLFGIYILSYIQINNSTSFNQQIDNHSLYRSNTDSSSSYIGPYWRTNQTVSAIELFNNKWMRVESHTIRTENGKLLNDWIWMDVIDQINVLPLIKHPNRKHPIHQHNDKFALFRQQKYGYIGEKLATVGGHIDVENNELPLVAAKRELKEEMNLIAQDNDWIYLGTYRTNVNRGGGLCSCYLAVNAKWDDNNPKLESDDLERQDIVYLTADELTASLLNHEIGEIKWAATIAMSLLQLQTMED